MLTRNEIERLASAIHGLRPDWPVPSLVKFIAKRERRPLLDLTIELSWVAQMPDTLTPARIDEDGPWKDAVRLRGRTSTTSLLEPIDFGTACTVCLKPLEHLWHGGTGTVSDHDFEHPKDHAPAPRPKENA